MGPSLEVNSPALLVVDDRADEVGGEEIGGELDARELGVEGVAERADGERLGEAGDALDQDVAAGEQADQDALDHVGLADDDLADLGQQLVDERALLGDQLVQCADVVHGMRDSRGREGDVATPRFTTEDAVDEASKTCGELRALAAHEGVAEPRMEPCARVASEGGGLFLLIVRGGGARSGLGVGACGAQ